VYIWLLYKYYLFLHSDPATLPRHEQLIKAFGVLQMNYSLLWYHLNVSKVLPLLLDKSIFSESLKKEVESYGHRCGQNAVIINALFTAEHLPEGLLIICDVLQTIPGKEYIAQLILRGIVSALFVILISR